jgi:hypothetical protein
LKKMMGDLEVVVGLVDTSLLAETWQTRSLSAPYGLLPIEQIEQEPQYVTHRAIPLELGDGLAEDLAVAEQILGGDPQALISKRSVNYFPVA